MADRSRARTVARWLAVSLGAILLAALLALALLDLNVLKHPIERMASARSGRSVVIDGRMRARIFSLTPAVTLDGLTVGNPPGEPAPAMLHTERLQLHVKLLPLLLGRVIFERIEMDKPVLYLHRDSEGHANWTFAASKPSAQAAAPPVRLPIVRNLLVRDGRLTLKDEMLHLDVDAQVHAHERATQEDPQAFQLVGTGTINKQPLRVHLIGGPLLTLQPDRPYPFTVHVEAGSMRLDSDGVVRKPFDLGRVGLVLRASGTDLADLYYLTQLAFPKTPPFQLRASIERDGTRIRVDPVAGEIGRSDVHGALNIDMSRKRPDVTGALVSKQLRLSDLAESLGGKPLPEAPPAGSLSKAAPRAAASKHEAPPATAPPQARLLPDARLQVDRVRAMNADVQFTATSVEAGTVLLKQVALHIKLNEGVLSLDPMEMQMPQGRLRGTAVIDARGKAPATRLDLRMSDIQLAQFKGKSPDAKAPLTGSLQARLVAAGSGDSLHDFAAAADGTATFVLPHGEINAAFAELTGVDVAHGLGLLLKGGQDREEVRCGIAQFNIQNGTMRVQDFVVDAKDVRITGRGEVRLGPEELDLSLRGEPKKFRLARLKAPVRITGHLLKPSIGLAAGPAVKQGAIATALGVALTPLAAVIAFVDPGLAKDADCAALLGDSAAAPDH